jgi:hypothetical protein
MVDEMRKAVPLQHVDFSDVRVAETFLQEVLDSAPEILPIDELDSSFGPLISLGREISCIDNLFISPNGRLTIVETKLWRNPEATRQVVAQILDYATRVSTWSYADLENKVRQEALPPSPLGVQSLYEYVASKTPDEVLSEAGFIDAVQQSLRDARFMLLIVGDGIRENIEAMVASLHDHPRRLFTFGLVQLQIYTDRTQPGRYLVVPQIVANSTEVYRYVIRVETTGQANVSVEIENREPEQSPRVARPTLSEDEFFDKIVDPQSKVVFRQLLDFAAGIGAVPVWGTSGVSIRLPDPAGSRTRYTLFVLTLAGNMYAAWLPQQLEKTGRPVEIAANYSKQLCAIFPTMTLAENGLETIGVAGGTAIAARWDAFTELVRSLVDQLQARV